MGLDDFPKTIDVVVGLGADETIDSSGAKVGVAIDVGDGVGLGVIRGLGFGAAD